MNKQIEKIKSAKKAYLYNIAPQSKLYKFAIYLDLGDGEALNPIWPDDCDKGKNAELLPYQVYSSKRDLAAYHFIPNYPEDLVKMLTKINPEIKVFMFERGAYLWQMVK